MKARNDPEVEYRRENWAKEFAVAAMPSIPIR
jgi:hypothetical protein